MFCVLWQLQLGIYRIIVKCALALCGNIRQESDVSIHEFTPSIKEMNTGFIQTHRLSQIHWCGEDKSPVMTSWLLNEFARWHILPCSDWDITKLNTVIPSLGLFFVSVITVCKLLIWEKQGTSTMKKSEVWGLLLSSTLWFRVQKVSTQNPVWQ